jgi:hypothetical protein
MLGIAGPSTAIPEIDVDPLLSGYEQRVRTSVQGCEMLDQAPPPLDVPVSRSVFLDEIFVAWGAHLASYGITWLPGTTEWCFSTPLIEIFKRSVFYPRHPVLWGPTYFAKIADRDRSHIVSTFGRRAVWEFYFAMMVFHEQSHFVQRGEPLVNEIGHAILWNDFIRRQRLESFQINSDTGHTCNREAPFILSRLARLRNNNLGLLFSDNAVFAREVLAPVSYSVLVGMAWLVHGRALTYQSFVNMVCGLLADDDVVIRWATEAADQAVADILMLCRGTDDRSVLRDLVSVSIPSFNGIAP